MIVSLYRKIRVRENCFFLNFLGNALVSCLFCLSGTIAEHGQEGTLIELRLRDNILARASRYSRDL